MPPRVVPLSPVRVSVHAGGLPAGAHRKEHCILAADLRRALGLEVGDQIRVGFPFQSGGAGDTANFTIHADGPAGSGLQLFSNTGPGGRDGGVSRLYGLGGQERLPAGLATVWSAAPSETRTNGVVLAGDDHFNEPNADPEARYFREIVHTGGADHQVLLLVPHGGAIDLHTSKQIEPFRRALTSASPAIWECQGKWRGQAAARWHVKSDLLRERSFPGLWRLLHEEAPHGPGVHFRYAVALHGFRWDSDDARKGIILGGTASREDKHIVIEEIRRAISKDAALGPPEVDRVAFYIADPGGAHERLPARDQAWDTGPACDDCFASKSGLSPDNIVNRLSCRRGGVQLEQSTAVRRDEDLCAAVARGVAAAVDRLLAQ